MFILLIDERLKIAALRTLANVRIAPEAGLKRSSLTLPRNPSLH